MSHLSKLLKAYPADAVLTESLFSMDGDSPDFAALADLKGENGFLCIVDEAHAFGVLAPEEGGLGRTVADVAVGTLGKAFGMFGAFILCPPDRARASDPFRAGASSTPRPCRPGTETWFWPCSTGSAGRDARREHLRLLGNLARRELPASGPAGSRSGAHPGAGSRRRETVADAWPRPLREAGNPGLRGPLPHRALGTGHAAGLSDRRAPRGRHIAAARRSLQARCTRRARHELRQDHLRHGHGYGCGQDRGQPARHAHPGRPATPCT